MKSTSILARYTLWSHILSLSFASPENWGVLFDSSVLNVAGHSAVGASNGLIYIYGGSIDRGVGLGQLNADVYTINSAAKTIVSLTGAQASAAKPPARANHIAALQVTTNSIVIWGGGDILGVKNDAYSYSIATNAWTSLTQHGMIPSGRSSMCSAVTVNPNDGTSALVMFGGIDGSGIALSDLFILSLPSFTWSLVPVANGVVSASGRAGASMLPFDTTHTPGAVPHCVLLYGGQSQDGSILSDLWVICPWAARPSLVWSQLSPTIPGIASTQHAAVMINDRMLVFGGYTGTFPVDYIATLREFDSILNVWREIAMAPSTIIGRSQLTMTYITVPASLVVFGGQTRYQVLGDAFSTSYAPPYCAMGQAYSADGTSCLPCSTGTFSPRQAAYSCQSCGAGSYSDSLGATACILCNAGTYSNVTRASSPSACGNCPAGTANPNMGSVSVAACITCSAGQVSAPGAALCTACGTGHYSPFAVNQCLQCASGTFSSSIVAQATCTDSPAGTYAPFTGMETAWNCPAGTYSAAKATSCTPCPAGRANGNTNGISLLGSCSPCPAGTYGNIVGLARCFPCPAGSALNGGTGSSTSASSCVSCLNGFFAAVQGSQSCTPCPAGTFQDGTDRTKCTACPIGSYSAQLHAASPTTCIPCSDGKTTVSAGAATSSACVNCASGYYGFNGQCYPCESGYASLAGATSCAPCNALQYTSGTGGQPCTSCLGLARLGDNSTSIFGYPGWGSCIDVSAAVTTSCPLGPNGISCSGNGNCIFGICSCFNGWDGLTCSIGICSGQPFMCQGYIEFASPSYSCIYGSTCLVSIVRSLGSSGVINFTIRSGVGGIVKTGTLASGTSFTTVDMIQAANSIPDEACVTIQLLLSLTSGTSNGQVGIKNSITLYFDESKFTSRVLGSNANDQRISYVSPSSIDALLDSTTLVLTVTVTRPTLATDIMPLDLVLVIDVGHSASSIRSLMASILPAFVASLPPASQSSIRFGLVTFSDTSTAPHGASGNSPFSIVRALTYSMESVLSLMRSAVDNNNGDAGSSLLYALQQTAVQAAAIGWRSASSCRRILMLTTGTTYRTDSDMPLVSALATSLNQAGIYPMLISALPVNLTALSLGIGIGVSTAVDVSDGYGSLNGLHTIFANSVLAQVYLSISNDDYALVTSVAPNLRSSVSPAETTTFTLSLTKSLTFSTLSASDSILITAPGFGSLTLNVVHRISQCPLGLLLWPHAATTPWPGFVLNQNFDVVSPPQLPGSNLGNNTYSIHWNIISGAFNLENTIGPNEVDTVTALKLVITATSPVTHVIRQVITHIQMQNALPFTLHAMSKAVGVTGVSDSSYMIAVSFTLQSGLTIFNAVQLKFATGTHGWQYLSDTFFPPAGVMSAFIDIVFSHTGHYAGTVYFYGIGLFPVPQVAAYCPNGQYNRLVSSLSYGGAWEYDLNAVKHYMKCEACPIGRSCVGGAQFGCSGNLFSFGGINCLPCLDGWLCANGEAKPCAHSLTDTYYADPTADTCRGCMAGYACHAGKLFQCKPGQYSIAGQLRCSFCSPGTISVDFGASGCENCPAGQTSGFGFSSCFDCPVGSTSRSGGKCIACPSDSYNDMPGHSSCKPCPIGYNSTGAGAALCSAFAP